MIVLLNNCDRCNALTADYVKISFMSCETSKETETKTICICPSCYARAEGQIHPRHQKNVDYGKVCNEVLNIMRDGKERTTMEITDEYFQSRPRKVNRRADRFMVKTACDKLLALGKLTMDKPGNQLFWRLAE